MYRNSTDHSNQAPRSGVTADARSVLAFARRAAHVAPLHLLALTLALTLSNISSLSAQTLESKNPFLPPGYGKEEVKKPAPVVQTNGPISREIEFRGLIKLNGKYQFSIFNKSEQKSYWLDESGAAQQGISVRGYDADSHTITVNMNGRSERLTLMTASDAPLPVAVSVSQPKNSNANQPQQLPAGLQNVVNNNNSSNSSTPRRVIPRRRVILPKK